MEPTDSVDSPIIPDIPDHHTPVKPVYLWVLFAVLAGLTALTVVMSITTLVILSLGLGHVQNAYTAETSLPKQYAVPYTHLSPIKPINGRTSSWVFATISLVEAALRRQATEAGVLNESEYISLSEQAYGKLMFQLCSRGPLSQQQTNFCKDTQVFVDPTKDGFVEMLYYFRNKNAHFFFPDSVCNYTEKVSHDPTANWPCDGVELETAPNNTPFKASIESIIAEYNPDAIKRRMYETQMPMSFGHVELGRSFLYPCDDKSPFRDSEDCVKKRYPCVHGYCSMVNTPSYSNNGSYLLNGQPINRGDHHMLIVGWNDELSGGGFILRNSWGTDRGHSLGYLVANYSLFNEDQVCPTLNSFTRWIPASFACLQNGGSPATCPNITRRFVNKLALGSTVLRCFPTPLATETTRQTARDFGFEDCGTEEGQRYNYVLESSLDDSTTLYNPQVDFPLESDGYGIYHLIRWLDPTGDEPVVYERVQTKYTTETLMERLFVPRDLAEYPNTEHCGNYFMPYDVFLEHHVRNPEGGFVNFAYSWVNVTFDPVGIAARELYEDAVKTCALPEFDGPFDFEI